MGVIGYVTDYAKNYCLSSSDVNTLAEEAYPSGLPGGYRSVGPA